MLPEVSIELRLRRASSQRRVERLERGNQCQKLAARFLVRINGDDPELMRSRVHLIRLQQGHDRRVVSTYTQNVFGGQRSKYYNDVAISKKDAEPDIWLMVTPEVPLAPGEYSIVFMPKDTNLAPDSVYYFDVVMRQLNQRRSYRFSPKHPRPD